MIPRFHFSSYTRFTGSGCYPFGSAFSSRCYTVHHTRHWLVLPVVHAVWLPVYTPQRHFHRGSFTFAHTVYRFRCTVRVRAVRRGCAVTVLHFTVGLRTHAVTYLIPATVGYRIPTQFTIPVDPGYVRLRFTHCGYRTATRLHFTRCRLRLLWFLIPRTFLAHGSLYSPASLHSAMTLPYGRDSRTVHSSCIKPVTVIVIVPIALLVLDRRITCITVIAIAGYRYGCYVGLRLDYRTVTGSTTFPFSFGLTLHFGSADYGSAHLHTRSAARGLLFTFACRTFGLRSFPFGSRLLVTFALLPTPARLDSLLRVRTFCYTPVWLLRLRVRLPHCTPFHARSVVGYTYWFLPHTCGSYTRSFGLGSLRSVWFCLPVTTPFTPARSCAPAGCAGYGCCTPRLQFVHVARSGSRSTTPPGSVVVIWFFAFPRIAAYYHGSLHCAARYRLHATATRLRTPGLFAVLFYVPACSFAGYLHTFTHAVTLPFIAAFTVVTRSAFCYVYGSGLPYARSRSAARSYVRLPTLPVYRYTVAVVFTHTFCSRTVLPHGYTTVCTAVT